MIDFLAQLIDVVRNNLSMWMMFWFVGGWFLLFLTSSIAYRTIHGKPILYVDPEEYRFRERHVSGMFREHWVPGNFGWSTNVYLTDEELVIRPVFPFNLFFIPEIVGGEYRIPYNNVRAVGRGEKNLFNITVQFQKETGEDMEANLRLQNPDSFLRELKDIQAAINITTPIMEN